MTIGQMFFIFTLVTKVSANYNGLRTTLLIMLNYDPIEYSNQVNYIMTAISLAVTTFIAAIFQNISDYISLIGSFCSVFVAVVMPGMIYIKDSDNPLTHIKNIFAILFVIILSIFGLFTSFCTIRGIMEHAR